jgi:hypothetical protein
MRVSGQRHAPAALYPEERTLGTRCTGGWVGPRDGLDTEARGNNLSASAGDRTSISRSSSPYLHTTLTEIPRLKKLVQGSNYSHRKAPFFPTVMETTETTCVSPTYRPILRDKRKTILLCTVLTIG